MTRLSNIWLTRPVDDNAILAEVLASYGIHTVHAPLLTIAPVSHVSLPTTPPAALLLTSRHAVHALPPAWAHIPVFCVGKATADAVRAKHYTQVITGESDVVSLLPRIAESCAGHDLLYLSGEEISVDVAALLETHQVRTQRMIVYRAIATTALSEEIKHALQAQQLTGVVLFSARTANIAVDLIRAAGLAEQAASLDAFCLSLPVAQQAAGIAWKHVRVAHMPTRDAMLEMIRTHS